MIAQLGERYSSDPLCVSVVLTCANFMSKEMHLPKTPEDRAKWSAMGDYGAKLLDVYKKYTDEWAKAFPKQQVTLHLSQVLDLPPSFFEARHRLWVKQISGALHHSELSAYGTQRRYRHAKLRPCSKIPDRAHHGFQSVAGFS